ncbi:MAG: hypothetical protein JW778_00535 [Candidatus Altiarchaeota archaeon]|nr:hypothetical protein [Candidatus Altiarchaeota archaeon]
MVKIKIKNVQTRQVDVFDVEERDTMKDVLQAMGFKVDDFFITDDQTGRFFDPRIKFGDTDKRSFGILKK